MLLACLAVGLISCRDTIDPREVRPPSQVQQQVATVPVTVLRLTCTLSFSNGEQGEVHCGEASARTKGMSSSVGLPLSSEYARWLPYYLVKDSVTETWSFLSVVENLLGQPIGTLDGTTAVGTRVAVTYGPVASAGTGTVSIVNADGTGTFTAPNQPYFDFRFTKNVVCVIFADSSTIVDRQLAVALVNGKVIGGEPVERGSGAYYPWVADDGTVPGLSSGPSHAG